MNMHRASILVVGAIALGILIGYMGMSIFGYLVAFPFPSPVLRSTWLVPLLRVIAWVPLVLFTAYALCKYFKGHPFFLSLIVGAASLAMLAVQSSEYIYSSGFVSVLQSLWPEVVFLIVVLPAATSMANNWLVRTPETTRHVS